MRLPPAPGDCPAVTAVQMVDVDRRAVACFDLSLVQTALGVP